MWLFGVPKIIGSLPVARGKSFEKDETVDEFSCLELVVWLSSKMVVVGKLSHNPYGTTEGWTSWSLIAAWIWGLSFTG